MKSLELFRSLEKIKRNKKVKTDKIFVKDIGISYMTYYRWKLKKKLRMSRMAKVIVKRFIQINKNYLNA